MLMITSFANPRVAQAFVDYMATQGVILTIQQHNQSDIWLADESQAETCAGRAGAVYRKSLRSALSGG
ncbi:GlpG protein (membrane protein of glp regulon) [Salmonella enterica subsp. enterica]|uniref:GlpG protein (Membrane protein of glp regulon) n=1 Tax=Salmonella enterica I TaxID=59201 RepID=A0A447TTD9_SALET|nr:GlpG protein (membrane protein of glp regulon) [Salmonella enterica subsp. enterica]